MIENYLNQTATWKQKTGNNEYGEPVFQADQIISVRWEEKRRLARDQYGNQVVSEARVFCRETVAPGDVLNYNGRDWPVITVSEVPLLNGQVLYREVLL